MSTEVSLDQWRALVAVVDEGGYAAAAEALGKSQSAVSYAVQKLETALGARAFALAGRKAELTEVGTTLYRRAKHLLEDAQLLEEAARTLGKGEEATVKVAVDTLFPVNLLMNAIAATSQRYTNTQFEILESTLSGPNEALMSGMADIVISAYPPPGALGVEVAEVTLEAVALASHPLHIIDRELTWNDLRKHRQVVVKDSGRRENRDAGWLGAEQRLSVSLGSTAVNAVTSGFAYAWLPSHLLPTGTQTEPLLPLRLAQGRVRTVRLYCYFSDRDYAGPATTLLGSELESVSKQR